MANYARLVNNTVVDISSDPSTQFHPSIASTFISVPDNVQIGWYKTGSTWNTPVPPPTLPPFTSLPYLTPVQFKMCFTPQERVQIIAIKETDSILKAAYEILDDPRLTQVDLSLGSVQQMIDYVKGLGIIDDARASEVKRGIVK